MKKPTAKKPARQMVSTPRTAEPRPPKRTQAERKAKTIELMLRAVAGGWSLRKFSRRSGVSIRSLLRYVAEPMVQPRYIQAMQIKAMLLPDEAMDMVRLLRDGGEFVTLPDPEKPGFFRQVWAPVDPKAIGVALRHLEFRMMREIKAVYQPSREVKRINETRDIPDDQIDARFAELMGRFQMANSGAGNVSPSVEDDKAGHK